MQNNLNSSGFTAGTLVHSKDGLVPIEEIKVGDLVLSRSEHREAGAGLSLKRVLKTLVHEDKEVKFIGYKNGPNLKKERTHALFSSLDHQFWVKDKGWTAASLLQGDWLGPSHLELSSCAPAFSVPMFIYKSDRDGIGWVASAGFEGEGFEWDFVKGEWGINSYFDTKNWPIHDVDDGGDGDGYRYTATVYNLEVDAFHSYFVGEHGVLVKSV
jgi:hypothetical protein